MQAFIKGNKLVVNTMIHKNELEEIKKYIEEAKDSKIVPITLYDVEGEISGIAFEIKKGEEDVRRD